jgi:hypothetical protein
MPKWYRVHLGNAHIISTHRWIANIIVLLVVSGNLGNLIWAEHWRDYVHDQETLPGRLLIIVTVEMIDKISFMPNGKS